MRLVTHQAPVWVLFFALVAASGVAHARPWEAREPAVDPKPAHQLRNPVTGPRSRTRRRADRRGEVHGGAGVPVRRARLADGRAGPEDHRRGRDSEERSVHARRAGAFGSRCKPDYKGKKGGRTGCSPSSPACTACRARRAAGGQERPDVEAAARSEVNLAVGATLLEMWKASHKEIDEASAAARTGAASRISSGVTRSVPAATRI